MIAVYVVSALAGAALLGTAVYHKNVISNLHNIGPNTVRAGLNIKKEKLDQARFIEAYHPDKHSSMSPGSSRNHSNNGHPSLKRAMTWGGKNTKRRRYKK